MTYQKISITQATIEQDQWKHTLLQPLPERTPYTLGEELVIPTIRKRILGVTYDETAYFMDLYELNASGKVHVLSEDLDKYISQEQFQAIQRVLMINQKEKGLSVNRFVAFLDGEQLLPKSSNYPLQRHLREVLMKVLHTFKESHDKGLYHPDFRRVLVDLIKWTWNHLDKWLQALSIENDMPRVIWYGEASKSQLYFLYYLMLVGCDVIIFHPEAKDDFMLLDPNQEFSQIIMNPTTMPLEPFPTEKPERQGTVAYRATKEMDEVLHHEGSQLYKPWQFRNHIPTSVTLKTTYDELFLIIKERAFIRPNFKATRTQVEIPNLFAKIMGVSENKREYWDRLQTLSEYKETIMIRHFPFTEEITTNYQFHYQHALNENGELDPDKMIKSNWWQFSHLPNGTQIAIAQVISNACRKPKLIRRNNETMDEVRLYLFTQLTKVPSRILQMLQTFDYSQSVPKVVLYNTEFNGTLSRSDAALLVLLNEFGIDIVIYNPPGHNCIENYISDEVFDTHWLEEMVFDQEFKEPSVLKKFLHSLQTKNFN